MSYFTYINIEERVQKLNDFDKLKVYMDYYISGISIQKTFNNLTLNQYSFKDFCDINKQKIVYDNGKNWKEHGFAERFTTNYYGIFAYYAKKGIPEFKNNKIEFKQDINNLNQLK